MNLRKTILLVLFFLAVILRSQDTWVIKINRGENRTTRQVIEYNERLFILNTGICDNLVECTLILEIDYYGNILWDKKIKWLDSASKSMVIQNDTIFLSGNHISGQKWLWHKMSINGGDSLATFEIYEQDNPYDRMFNLGQVAYNNGFCIYGSGGKGAFTDESVFYFIDNSGKLDTQIIILPTEYISSPWEVVPDNEGNLLAFLWYQDSPQDNFRRIIKIDSNLDTSLVYNSEADQSNQTVPNGAILSDNIIVYKTDNESTNGGKSHSIRAINPTDGTIKWKYFSPSGGTLERTFLKIQSLNDGSILGTGTFGDLEAEPHIRRAPWIIKVSADGEKIWEHVYYDIAPHEDKTRQGFFYDAVELEDGSFIVVGNTNDDNISPQQILIARLDADGCLMENCPILNDISDFVSDNKNLSFQDFTLFPNPTQNTLHISIEKIPQRIEIYALDGTKMLTKEDSQEIDTSIIPSGLYYIKMFVDGQVGVRSFVKM